MIIITSTLSIPENEINFITSRSSGPGGQHVNKTSSKVTLVFDLQNSASLNHAQRERLRVKLGNRINQNGELSISCEEHRSQFRNKEAAVERFIKLVREALKPEKKRRNTKVPFASRRARMNSKRKRSDIKKNRSKPDY